ncbi:MAG: class D sortase [Candidatus Gracilibacteria bacterium]|jgi:sortase A
MPEQKPKKTRTKTIKIQSEVNAAETAANTEDLTNTAASPVANAATAAATEPHKSYELHIEAAQAPNEVKVTRSTVSLPVSAAAHRESHNSGTGMSAQKATAAAAKTPNPAANRSPKPSKSSPLAIKIWNTLEWIATSALIFAVLFFVINFQAYSSILLDKLNKLRGQVEVQYLPQAIDNHGAASQSQQPLPLAAQDKKQVPPLMMDIAPPDERIIIPRINKNVPIVKTTDQNLVKRDWSALEKDIQGALRDGVVHYPGTAEPGEKGNVVITGHSSYFAWDPGRFKDVFALLHQVVIGDKILVYHNQKLFVYEVYDIKVVTPDKVDVLTQGNGDKLTLITCTPVGTNLKRLVVIAKPVTN